MGPGDGDGNGGNDDAVVPLSAVRIADAVTQSCRRAIAGENAPGMLRTATACLLFPLLLATCATSRGEWGWLVGTHAWIGPTGEGLLQLRDDGSFDLRLGVGDGAPQAITGDWSAEPVVGWGAANAPPHREVWVALRVRTDPEGEGQVQLPMGTRLDALLSDAGASYLGFDGVVDLNWGF